MGYNIAQKHRYHAKSVTVKYFDEKKKQRGKAEKYNLEDKDFDMQKFQLSQARKKVKSVAIYIDDVYENPIRKKFPYLYDTFKKFDKKTWIFPDKKAITYDYGLENQAGHAKGIYFSGDAENQLAIHSAQAWPATGTTITGAVVGAPGKCNDHFIMISTKPQRKWSFGHSPDVLKFAYNCDELAIYQMEEPGRGKRQPRVIPCRATGKKHRFQIKLEQDGVGFVSMLVQILKIVQFQITAVTQKFMIVTTHLQQSRVSQLKIFTFILVQVKIGNKRQRNHILK